MGRQRRLCQERVGIPDRTVLHRSRTRASNRKHASPDNAGTSPAPMFPSALGSHRYGIHLGICKRTDRSCSLPATRICKTSRHRRLPPEPADKDSGDRVMKRLDADIFLKSISMKTAASRRPEGMTFELTYGCNLRCVHC